ncbi:hypothetical protein C8Q77DRAFT_796581 [Trametes polyzona]|nr:hypothetical protein C8Q77DRAFT_796581 [Trametes polyzona]
MPKQFHLCEASPAPLDVEALTRGDPAEVYSPTLSSLPSLTPGTSAVSSAASSRAPHSIEPLLYSGPPNSGPKPLPRTPTKPKTGPSPPPHTPSKHKARLHTHTPPERRLPAVQFLLDAEARPRAGAHTDSSAAVRASGMQVPVWNGPEWDERKLDVSVLLTLLFCDEEQMTHMRAINHNKEHQSFVFNNRNQYKAQDWLRRHQLDKKSLESLESKWKVSGTSGRRSTQKTMGTIVRAMYQCACGYYRNPRQQRETRGKSSTVEGDGGPSESGDVDDDDDGGWTRRAPYAFTGCLAHADITYVEESGFVLRIKAYLEHNAACQSAPMVRFPAVPLHPHVIKVAQEQLRGNASVSQIRNKNLELLTAETYQDQRVSQGAHANHRYNLLSSDFRSLYRRHYREHYGININVAPELNVHNWLDKDSRYFKPALSDAIFKYSARMSKEERAIVCISTAEMRDAAWRYCHGKQLVLDGTFGLCDSRILLWIAMGVDEENSGIPVAMFLFSAPTGSKATHAGYDTAILSQLFQHWRDWLSLPENRAACTDPDPSAVFAPAVAMTDTDAKERGALLRTWPSVILLLCRFHVRQCWTNRRSMVLKTLDPSWRGRVEASLQALEEALLDTAEHEDAVRLLGRLETLYSQAAGEGPDAHRALAAVKEFLGYLRGTWMAREMWHSWARKGRMDAAAVMKIAVEVVLTTTNHLESFNGKLKGAHIPQWQHSGRRLRFDILVYHLVEDILPRIFARHRVATAYTTWKTERFRSAAGGVDLRSLAEGSARASAKACGTGYTPGFTPRTWYEPDARRDLAAKSLFDDRHLNPVRADCPYELWATCRSSKTPTEYYSLTVHPSGVATCSCLDWRRRGGACKHLRAFRLLIDEWIKAGALSHRFLFPLTEAEAAETEERNRQWYGAAYDSAVTTSPPVASSIEPPTDETAARSPPIHPVPTSSCPRTVLPPAHLDDMLSTSLALALELEAFEASEDAMAAEEGASSVTEAGSAAPSDGRMVRLLRPQIRCTPP